MRVVDVSGGFVRIELTRRNLRSLLAKLDGHPPNSACTIISPDDHEVTVVVTAVEDVKHYGSRRPGAMIEDTEQELQRESNHCNWCNTATANLRMATGDINAVSRCVKHGGTFTMPGESS